MRADRTYERAARGGTIRGHCRRGALHVHREVGRPYTACVTERDLVVSVVDEQNREWVGEWVSGCVCQRERRDSRDRAG
jgi:hypothetical protein